MFTEENIDQYIYYENDKYHIRIQENIKDCFDIAILKTNLLNGKIRVPKDRVFYIDNIKINVKNNSNKDVLYEIYALKKKARDQYKTYDPYSRKNQQIIRKVQIDSIINFALNDIAGDIVKRSPISTPKERDEISKLILIAKDCLEEALRINNQTDIK